MPNPLDIAQATLLEPASLREQDLDQTMDQLLANKIDAADIYFQAGRLESWVLEEGIIREGSYSIEQGVGVRAINGEKTGFAYSDQVELPALLEAARTARAIARSGQQARINITPNPTRQSTISQSTPWTR